MRCSGQPVEHKTYAPLDSLRAEFDAFAAAVEGVAPYPITPAEMTATIAMFEAVIRSLESGKPVDIA